VILITTLAVVAMSGQTFPGEQLWRAYGAKLQTANTLSFTVRFQIPAMDGQDATEDFAFMRTNRSNEMHRSLIHARATGGDKKEVFFGVCDGLYSWYVDPAFPTKVDRWPAADQKRLLADFSVSFGYLVPSGSRYNVIDGSRALVKWDGQESYSIKLTDASFPQRTYQLFVDPHTGEPVGLSQLGQSMETRYTYRNVQLNVTFPPDYFTYAVPNGVTVADHKLKG